MNITDQASEGVLPEPKRLRIDNSRCRPRPGGDYEKEWARCTEQAREHWLGINRNRIAIAELALEVCDVSWGGGDHWSGFQGRKTLWQFAQDAGINYKTLNGYCHIKTKIIDRLPPGVFDQANWGAANRCLAEVQKLRDQDSDPATILKLYTAEKTRCGSRSRSYLLRKYLKHVKSHLQKIDWDLVKEEESEEINELITEIAELYEGEDDEKFTVDEPSDSGENPPAHTISLGEEFDFDAAELIKTRMLIQANSGGGKSWLIRRLVEEAHAHYPVILFDVEGEFGGLTKLYQDFIHQDASEESISLDIVRSGVSVVIDLSDLDPDARLKKVKLLLQSLIAWPLRATDGVFVVIDEAHLFAPQRGRSPCRNAVIDVSCRGRKRGLCLILATQRLAKLSKDCAAELLNKVIGRTNLDIDVKRAMSELMIHDAAVLRNLAPGEFLATGPAISDDVYQYQVGATETVHD